MRALFKLGMAAIALLGLMGGLAEAEGLANSRDHPLIKRYEGSQILFYKQESHGPLKLPLEAIVFNYNAQKFEEYKRLDVEGKRTPINYSNPPGVGTLEVARNYENELKAKGFEILFSGSDEAIERNRRDNIATEIYGANPDTINFDHREIMALTAADRKKSFYIAAKLARPETEGDVYVSVFVIEASHAAAAAFKIPEKSTLTRLDVCEVKPMQQKMVTISAEEMQSQILSAGKVALYGIYFDFNKADVKSESTPTLDQIAKLLEKEPRLKLLVVGHTDGIGTFEPNRALSQRRAESVVKELVQRYHVDPKRLFPVGVSFAAPVTTNSTEEGRAKNRRVELVEMYEAK